MKHLISLFMLIIAFSSCRSMKYTPIESTKKVEYRTRDIVHYDSIFQKDSIYIVATGDTIYKTEIKYLYRYLTVNRSDTILKTDSVLVPYPIEKQLTRWQLMKVELGGWALGAIIIAIIAFVINKKIRS